jgi:hypothetical protein
MIYYRLYTSHLFTYIQKKLKLNKRSDIEKLDELSNSKDYIDISISNSLL